MWSAAHAIMCICIAMLGRRPILHSVLTTKMRQAPMENNIKHTKHIRAKRNSSEGLLNDMWNICSDKILTKKKPLLDLQRLQWYHPSAVLLQTQLCSRGGCFPIDQLPFDPVTFDQLVGTCLGWNLSCFSNNSVAGDINVKMSSCLEPVMSCALWIMW